MLSITASHQPPVWVIIPDAHVTAVEVSTGAVTRSTGNSAGFCVLTAVAPG